MPYTPTRLAEGSLTKYGKRLTVTLSDDMFDLVKREAIENCRSMTSQVIYMLESFVLPKYRGDRATGQTGVTNDNR